MIANSPFIVKISTKLIIQVIFAFLLMVIILFKIHYNVESSFSSNFNTIPTITLDCPLKSIFHRFELTKYPDGVEAPQFNKLYFQSGISHWLYLLLGTILFTLIFQVKLEIEPIRKIKESINDKLTQNLLFIAFIIIMIGLLIFYGFI